MDGIDIREGLKIIHVECFEGCCCSIGTRGFGQLRISFELHTGQSWRNCRAVRCIAPDVSKAKKTSQGGAG